MASNKERRFDEHLNDQEVILTFHIEMALKVSKEVFGDYFGMIDVVRMRG